MIHVLVSMLCVSYAPQEKEVLADDILSDPEFMPKLRNEFIEDMNTMLVLAAHGPM